MTADMSECGQVELWANREFGGVHLGDMRRTARLMSIAAGMAEDPARAISTSCGRSGAQAVSRLFAREEVCVESVLESHIEETRKRCEGHSRVLGVQDTTVLDFTSHTAKQGIGPVTTSECSRGLLMHSMLIVSEGKTPLGLGGAQIWSRDQEDRGCAKDRRKRSISQKESNKWIVGLRQAESAVPDDCELVVVGDRESDVYALFAAPRAARTHLLVRVAQDRAVDDEEHRLLSQAVGAAPVVGAHKVQVPRKPGQPAREAWLEIRLTSVYLKPPANGAYDGPKHQIKVWIVRASEINAPGGVEAIDWILLTTEPVSDLEGAVQVVKEYAVRWVIEEFHRVLKTGCRVERMQFENAGSLSPAIAMSAVVAWRILYITKLSREQPEADVAIIAAPEEVLVLEHWLVAKKEKLRQIRTANEFVFAVALLGGFMGRKRDGAPGTKILWQGLRRLEDLLIGYKLATGQEIR